MQPEDQARVSQIARYTMKNEKGETVRFLTKDEEDNLNIAYGTLSKTERESSITTSRRPSRCSRRCLGRATS
jgi:hypothetical protein